MPKIIRGERVGRLGRLAVGCSASVFDETGEKMLLVRRVDNGRWAVPGGYMDPGESVAEAAAREVWEETGLEVAVTRLVGVYSTPHVLLEYDDGNRWQLVVLHFVAEVMNGDLGTSAETSECRYLTQVEARQLEMAELDRLRVEDAFAAQADTFIR